MARPITRRSFTVRCRWCSDSFSFFGNTDDDRSFCSRDCYMSFLMSLGQTKAERVPRRNWKLPEDADMTEPLRELYERRNMTTTEIAGIFGVTHKAISGAMKRIGIPRRPVGKSRYTVCCEDGCVLPIFRIRHKTNGSLYGRRCRLHWIAFRSNVCSRWYDNTTGKGGDEQWLRRLRQALALAQRLNREVSQSLKLG